jgi:putative serine protease PepD
LAGTAHATQSGSGRWSGGPGVAAAFAALLLSGTALVFATTTRTAQPTGGPPAPSTGACDATAVAARTMPSVVTLFVTSATGGASNGSGEFLDTAGHVLTNNHVISSAVGGGTIVVLRPNGEELPATLVGRDISTDLAVVKVEPKEPAQPVASTSPRPRSAGPPPGPA